MAHQVYAHPEESGIRSRTSNTRRLKYTVIADSMAADAGDIDAAVGAVAPPFVDGLIMTTIEPEYMRGVLWHVNVIYGFESSTSLDGQPGQPTDPGDPTPPTPPAEPTATDNVGADLSFTTQGQTTHIVRSLKTISMTPRVAGANVPNHKQAIGVTKDAIEGCDIISSKFEWTYTRSVGSITRKYMKDLKKCTGKTNSVDWHGWEAGSLLFLGCSGRYSGAGGGSGWEITYNFLYNENEVNIKIDDTDPAFVVSSKKGHEYLWVGFVQKLDANSKLVMEPEYAYVEQVYGEENFKTLLGF